MHAELYHPWHIKVFLSNVSRIIKLVIQILEKSKRFMKILKRIRTAKNKIKQIKNKYLSKFINLLIRYRRGKNNK